MKIGNPATGVANNAVKFDEQDSKVVNNDASKAEHE